MCDEGIEIKCNFAQRERRMGDWSKAKRYHQRFGLEDIFSFSISVFSISSYHHSFIFLITPLSFTAPRPLSFACQNCDSCAFFKSSYISVCTMRPILMHVTRESLNWPVDQPITASSDLSFSHFTYEKFAAFFWILRRSQAEMLRAFWRVFVIFCRKSRLTRRNLHNFVGKSNASSSGTRSEKICYKMHVRK